ncbi:MAG: winged helix-turn-helix transcriptional regulator [Deltaproteobacteria bacterium]|nr:winged helix-turn-helix transcriptional regulator [Deltaproteobacteria bacterium]
MKEVFKLHAEVCKTLANAKRLEIIYALRDGERGVDEMTRMLGLKKANVSQHLGVLRAAGVVKTRREGVNVYYRIANPKIIKACAMMREVMMEMLGERQSMLRILKGRR